VTSYGEKQKSEMQIGLYHDWSLIFSNEFIRSGLSVSQLIEKAKTDELERRRLEAEKLRAATSRLRESPRQAPSTEHKKIPPLPVAPRKDASPFKVRILT